MGDSWLAAVTSSGLLAALLWLCRTAIVERLGRSVQHEFDRKIESIRSDLRMAEQRFGADLKTRDAENEALRGGALAALSARQAMLDHRRLVAVQRVWAAAVSLHGARAAAGIIAVLERVGAMTRAQKCPDLRRLLASSLSARVDAQLAAEVESERPFVSDLAWALFGAYRLTLSLAVARAYLLERDMNFSEVFDKSGILQTIKVALPHRVSFLDKHGVDGAFRLIGELERKLLDELRSSLLGQASSEEVIAQAAAIMNAAGSALDARASALPGAMGDRYGPAGPDRRAAA